MSKPSFLSTVVLLLSFSLLLQGQTSEFLPLNKNLSFNGKFITDITGDSYKNISDNGIFKCTYDIGLVSDENREIVDFKLFENDNLIYSKNIIHGSDVLISNSGYVTVFDMQFHFKQEISIHFYDRYGEYLSVQKFRYASLFGFSPSGNIFVAGTDKNLNIINLVTGKIDQVEDCSKFAFSDDEKFLITAKEDKISIYQNFELIRQINSGFFYPRGIIISESENIIAAIDKTQLKTYDIENGNLLFNLSLAEYYSFRDIIFHEGLILTGVHYKYNGISKGILKIFNPEGDLISENEMAIKEYPVFDNNKEPQKTTYDYDEIPWPFVPFDEVHKVWNHYEQHMGDGSGDWSYLHQGLDIEVPIDEPTYAVEEGWVKLVLTLGGAIYWRVAVSPVQVSGYSDGWLYAHLVESSIQVDVGDYVQVHDYLGDIIYWANDWGHIHFVNIKDQGDIWYYDDDEWGINFNPLLALNPITDDVPPIIEEFSTSSKFGFTENETSNYLDPDSLYGDIDIIVEISDYHGFSEWEQPAFKTYYWFNKLPENTTVFPKTLGQILNHQYSFYSSGSYYPYADIIYKKDYWHPSPPWMNWDRDYFQILTNNNGDSIIELSEAQLAFPTLDYPDGEYRLFVEAWDEFGNMAIDSQDVEIDNLETDIDGNVNSGFSLSCYP
ncbi:MAG: hypothetical protein K8R86_07505, partial [Bacteroidales bacterium]|nr:hypothetical protein [Bacteroidales bacterium]